MVDNIYNSILNRIHCPVDTIFFHPHYICWRRMFFL